VRRLHLFEFVDQSWLPRVFRDFSTDHLRYSHTEPMRAPVNLAIAERLASVLDGASTTQIIDLCGGGGGPVVEIGRILAEELSRPVNILLTDLYPNVAAFRGIEARSDGRVAVRYEPTDATDVPTELKGVRTMFAALHHFKPAGVRLVLADAVRKRAPIAVFEPLVRTPQMVMLVGLMSFLRGFTHTHRVERLTVARFLLTYVLPLAPALFAWDGAVSTIRMYTPDELLELARSIPSREHQWEAGRFDIPGPFGPMPTTFLIGVPV
jgi:hypothetical protein